MKRYIVFHSALQRLQTVLLIWRAGYVVADIGSWTKDIISIVDKRIDTEKSVTVPNSIITLFGEINDGVMQIGCGRILEEVLQDFIIGKEVVMPEKAQAVVISKLKEFAMEIEGLLGESGFDLDYCNVLYIGGGCNHYEAVW